MGGWMAEPLTFAEWVQGPCKTFGCFIKQGESLFECVLCGRTYKSVDRDL